MAKEVKFSLVFRDMWQSAGKYQPRVDQLVKVAPAIIKMGCFDRVETNGGGFEQVNLLYGENPNKSVRQWTKPFHEAGIQTHMLDRALNALRMSPCPKDLRQLFYKVKKAQGTDITRIFCGLNDTRNIIPSIKYAKAAGMIAQASLCITHSPIHTVEYYVNLAKELIDAGADEICLKDMAGIGRPDSLGKIVAGIKAYKKDIVIQYHSHSGPGFNMASILEVCKNGCDYVDTAVAPLAWGTGHADIIAVQEMLKDAGFKVKDINMEAYMEVRSQIQEMMDDFLGYYCPELNRINNSLLVKPGLPGGMMGSLMTDLEENLASLNKWKVKHGEKELSTDELLIKLFDEVAYVWPKVGYPPLVTPFSQYVKNIALTNLLTLEQGKGRYVMMDDAMWGMVLGKSGRIPGEIAPELKELAAKQGREFTDADPHTLIPNALDDFRKEMDENGWDYGQDDEELYELGMHPEQYRNFKSGQAKKNFLADLQKAKDAKLGAKLTPAQIAEFKHAKADAIVAPVKGQVYWEFNGDGECAPTVEPYIGKEYAEGDRLCYIQAPWGEIVEVPAAIGGRLVEINTKRGSHVQKGQVIAYIERPGQ